MNESKFKYWQMKLTQNQVKALSIGQTLVVKCDTAAQWESAKRIAHKVKQCYQREDGYAYVVNQSVADLSVTISLAKVLWYATLPTSIPMVCIPLARLANSCRYAVQRLWKPAKWASNVAVSATQSDLTGARLSMVPTYFAFGEGHFEIAYAVMRQWHREHRTLKFWNIHSRGEGDVVWKALPRATTEPRLCNGVVPKKQSWVINELLFILIYFSRVV